MKAISATSGYGNSTPSTRNTAQPTQGTANSTAIDVRIRPNLKGASPFSVEPAPNPHIRAWPNLKGAWHPLGSEPLGAGRRRQDMRRLLITLSLAAALVAAPSAIAGGWATVGLDSTPAGVQPGTPWNVNIEVLQHGKTPLEGVQPTLTIRNGDASRRSTRRRPPSRACTP